MRVREAIVAAPMELTVGALEDRHRARAPSRRVDVGLPRPLRPPRRAARRRCGASSACSRRSRRRPCRLLILGETGTGKELVAKAIHEASAATPPDRSSSSTAASIPPTLAESILFGHEKGAFTGAAERRKGALAEADGGTLFLDELGELPLELQPKLLRALSEKQVKRVGGSTFEPIDVRVLAATRRDLGAEMNAGRFRSDLFFRIAQVRIELPPLRERTDDIPLLVEDDLPARGQAAARRRRCSRGSSSGWRRTTGRATCASWSTWRASRRRSPTSPAPSTTS